MIHIINIKEEDRSTNPGYFYVGRSKNNNSPLGNPFTHNGKRSNIAKLTFKTVDEAIDAYERYFDVMYGNDKAFTNAFDEIYEYYKTGNDVYLGCFCAPGKCHASIIAKKLQQRLIKEKMNELKHMAKKRQ